MYLNSQKIQNKFLVAEYLRLSNDDGDKAESDSIRNQRSLIADFIKKHNEFTVVDEYVDDGYSGTNFERPAFIRMIEDIKRKRINCIIVKDLSRFGRNYIETGRYLEQIFPALGVRFIAITDNYDSADKTNDADQIIIPFKNLLNDAYCRDISIKIRSQLDVKRKNGQFIGSFAGYGYMKDPKDRNRLIIDEEAAEIVRLIFKMKLEGVSQQHIAKKLNDMGVLTPMEYKRNCGLNYNSGFRGGDKTKWIAMSINRILTNELYMGTMVQGKNKKINYKIKKSRPVDKKDWIRVVGTHDAIIPPDVFWSVQELLKLDTRTAPNKKNVYLFSGILRCADCGENMVRRTATKNGKKYIYYHCSTYKNGEGCFSHMISDKQLQALVLQAIRQQVALLEDIDAAIDNMEQKPEEQIGIKVLDKQIAVLDTEIEKYRELKSHLYQDFHDGLVSKEEYTEINERFGKKIRDAEQKKYEIQEQRERKMGNPKEMLDIVKAFKEFKNIETLDRRTVITLIDHIEVFDKNNVKIHFNHEDDMLELLAMAMDDSDVKEVMAV